MEIKSLENYWRFVINLYKTNSANVLQKLIRLTYNMITLAVALEHILQFSQNHSTFDLSNVCSKYMTEPLRTIL